MEKNSLNLAGTRIAAGLARRVRRLRSRLFAPDPHAARTEAALELAAAAPLSGQVILITGSTRGVGFALAGALSKAGARIVVNGRDAARTAAAAERLRAQGADVHQIAADLATPEGAALLVREAVAHYGRIDSLINNAAVAGPVFTPAWKIEPAQWREVLEANATAVFYCAREAMGWMVANGVQGRIVNVSSGAGRAGVAGMAPYVASKFALEGLTRSLALDAEGTGIVVCAIELGTVRTEMSRAVVRFEDHHNLPPPETVVPAFVHALTGPREQVAGRVYAEWRYAADPAAEAALARPLAQFPRFAFTPPKALDRTFDRNAPGMQLFDRAENPLGMPGRVKSMLATGHAQLDFSRYPSISYDRLRTALSNRLGLPGDQFTFAPGSAELVERIVRVFGGTTEQVIATEPTWFMFDRYCLMHEVALHKVPMLQRQPDGAFEFDLDAIAAAVKPSTRMIYLINPSNPLGNGIDRAAFDAFLARVPPDIPVVVDEAYLEFSESPTLLRTHEAVRDADPDRLLIGLRTFSKFYGLAGLRIGYAFATPRAMRLLERLEHLFCISSLAEQAAVEALEDEAHASATHALLRTEKARMAAILGEGGLACVPSEVHFMLVQCPTAPADVEHVWAAFIDAGIIVPMGLMYDRYLMLPVLTPARNDRHMQILLDLAARHRAGSGATP